MWHCQPSPITHEDGLITPAPPAGLSLASTDIQQHGLSLSLEHPIGAQLEHSLQIGHCPRNVARRSEEQTAVEISPWFAGVKLDRAIVVGPFQVSFAQFDEGVGTLPVRHRPVRRQAECLVAVADGRVQLVLEEVREPCRLSASSASATVEKYDSRGIPLATNLGVQELPQQLFRGLTSYRSLLSALARWKIRIRRSMRPFQGDKPWETLE